MVHAYMTSLVHVQETRKLSVAAGGAGAGGDRRGLPGPPPAGTRAEPHASKLLPFTGAARAWLQCPMLVKACFVAEQPAYSHKLLTGLVEHVLTSVCWKASLQSTTRLRRHAAGGRACCWQPQRRSRGGAIVRRGCAGDAVQEQRERAGFPRPEHGTCGTTGAPARIGPLAWQQRA